MTLVVCLVAFVAFVAIARRLKALDDAEGTQAGWPADRNRHDWH